MAPNPAMQDELVTEVRRIADLLEARLPQPAAAGATAPVDAKAVQLDASGEKVFEALRAWRREKARAEGVSPYIVAYDRTLREVARSRPGSVEALQELPGFGPNKAAKYGSEILEVVAAA
jgi:ATP-dependent DNA helicase RecQ